MRLVQKILLALGILLIAGSVYYISRNKTVVPDVESMMEGEHHTVVLSSAGYSPKELTIKKGDVVTFSTDRGFEHWPASDVHPTHNEYADFDPKRPLAPSEVWNFQFTKEGNWAFHDHLNSTFTGTVTVIK